MKIKKEVDDRKGYLGGSSWGAALGLSTYKTKLDVYKDYIGMEKPPVDAETQEIFDMGHILEDVVSRITAKKFGITPKKSNFLYLSDRDNRLGCHPDRLSEFEGKKLGIEIKTSSSHDNKRWGSADSDEIPYDYLIQCYSYFECCGVDEVWLMRFSDNRLTRYIIHKPDSPVMDGLCNQLIQFMDDADDGHAPEPDTLKELMDSSEPNPGDIEAPDGVMAIVGDWIEIKAQKKALGEKEEVCKKSIVKFLVDNEKNRLINPSTGKAVATYSKVEKEDFDKKSFKKDYPDLYEKYRSVSSYTQLR